VIVLLLAYIYVSWWQYRRSWTGEDLKWYEWSYHFLIPKRAVRAEFDQTHLSLRFSQPEAGKTETLSETVSALVTMDLKPNMEEEEARAEDEKRFFVPEVIAEAKKVDGWVIRQQGESEKVWAGIKRDINEGNPPCACVPRGPIAAYLNVLLIPFKFVFTYGIFAADGKERAVRTFNSSRPDIMTVHNSAKKYNDRTEIVFMQLQMMTSMIASFSHGANDVANAMGPLSTILGVYRCTVPSVAGKACSSPNPSYSASVPGSIKEYSAVNGFETPIWMLAVGGIMIGIGFTSYGYNLMRTLGNNLTYHSPSRAYCMELGAAIIVLLASRVGLPISTTQCITGATIAVGLLNGVRGVNWVRFGQIFLSWVVTMPIVGIYAGLLFLFLASNPSFRYPGPY